MIYKSEMTEQISNIACISHGAKCKYIGNYKKGCECYSYYEWHKDQHFIRHQLCDDCNDKVKIHNYLISDAQKKIDHLRLTIANQIDKQQSIIQIHKNIVMPIVLVGQKPIDSERTANAITKILTSRVEDSGV